MVYKCRLIHFDKFKTLARDADKGTEHAGMETRGVLKISAPPF